MAHRYLYDKIRWDRKVPAFHRNWTYKDIVVDIHCKELDKMAAKLSVSTPGLVAYLACYRKAFKMIEEGLEEAQVKYQAEVKQWSEHKPPPRQQQQWVMPIILSDIN